MREFDAAEAARLITETREDDKRMTPGPWGEGMIDGQVGGDIHHCDGPVHVLTVTDEGLVADPAAIARLRNNAKPLADQLEAAMAEIDRLRLRLTKPCMVRLDPVPAYTGPCVCSPESDCVYHGTLKRDAAREP